MDLLLDDVRPGGAVVAHHPHDSGTGRIQQAVQRWAIQLDDPVVSPSCREPPIPAAPLSSMTWPAAYSTDGAAASGLTTIHQMVTACPASSPLLRSEKEMPLSLRTSVEVPTALAELVTGLVLTGLVLTLLEPEGG